MQAGILIEGGDSVMKRLREETAKKIADSGKNVSVGFTAAYAVYLHEMLEERIKNLGGDKPRESGLGEYWGPSQTGPKFLTGALADNADKLAKIIQNAISGGKTVTQAIYLAGLVLQREAQLRVPVEYGFLKASAFTVVE